MGSVLSAALVVFSVLASVVTAPLVRVDREAMVMGSRLRMEVVAQSEEIAHGVIDRAFASAAELEGRWAVSLSELADVRRAGVAVPVALSPETFDLLSRAWYLADRTDGAFESAIGPLLEAWSARPDPSDVPAAPDLRKALASVGRGCFDLSPATRTIARYCPDAWIDGSGLEKGVALATIQQILEEESIEAARVIFGGQVLVRGSARTLEPIGIPDPRGDGVAFLLPAREGSVATTSQAGRARQISEALGEGPIVDPHTGMPVQDWGSATVRSDDPIEAEALSMALFVMGPEAGIRWLAARPAVDAVFLVSSGTGVIACGRSELIDQLRPQTSDAGISRAPLAAIGLRACVLPTRGAG